MGRDRPSGLHRPICPLYLRDSGGWRRVPLRWMRRRSLRPHRSPDLNCRARSFCLSGSGGLRLRRLKGSSLPRDGRTIAFRLRLLQGRGRWNRRRWQRSLLGRSGFCCRLRRGSVVPCALCIAPRPDPLDEDASIDRTVCKVSAAACVGAFAAASRCCLCRVACPLPDPRAARRAAGQPDGSANRSAEIGGCRTDALGGRFCGTRRASGGRLCGFAAGRCRHRLCRWYCVRLDTAARRCCATLPGR